MKLEKIYNILKNFSLDEFYAPQNVDPIFIYKYDVNLTIQQQDDSIQEDINQYNKFIVDLYEQSGIHTDTSNGITKAQWSLKYRDNTIYKLSFLNISGMMIPLSLKSADYEYNFCKVYNTTHHALNAFKLDYYIKAVKTNFNDFCTG